MKIYFEVYTCICRYQLLAAESSQETDEKDLQFAAKVAVAN